MKAGKIKIKNGAFVLLFSLLVSSILLATGLGISRLMIRQITLTSLSRESQVAFFAADSGLECALHWNVLNRFATSTPTGSDPRTIYCNGETITDGGQGKIQGTNIGTCDLNQPPGTNVINGGDKSCFTFSLPISENPKVYACAFVFVDKTDPLGLTTKITSNGYNKCNLNASNILQRTLEKSIVNEY